MIKPIVPEGQLSIDLTSQTNSLSLSLPLSRSGGGGLEVSSGMTPYSNTGSKSQTITNTEDSRGKGFEFKVHEGNEDWAAWVDYLQGTARCNFAQLGNLIKYLKSLTPDEYVLGVDTQYYVGNRRYQNSYTSLSGVRINWSVTADIETTTEISALQPSTQLSLHISIPGKPLNAMGVKNALQLMEQLRQDYQFSCSRIDTKVRDYARVTNRDELDSAIERGDVRGLDYYVQYDSGSLRGNRKLRLGAVERDRTKGFSRIFGSPQSDRRVTFYDALPVHGVDATDVEVRLRAELAKAAYSQILGTPDDNKNWGQMVRTIQGIVAGSIDFIHRIDGERNLDRCQRYAFWEKFRAFMDKPIRVSKPRRAFDVVRQKHWLERQAYRAVGMMHEVMGERFFSLWIDDMVKYAKSKFTPLHDAQITLYKNLQLHKVKLVGYPNDYHLAMSALRD